MEHLVPVVVGDVVVGLPLHGPQLNDLQKLETCYQVESSVAAGVPQKDLSDKENYQVTKVTRPRQAFSRIFCNICRVAKSQDKKKVSKSRYKFLSCKI